MLSVSGDSVGSLNVRASVAPAMRNISEIVESFRLKVLRMNSPIVAKKKISVRVSIFPLIEYSEYNAGGGDGPRGCASV